jgi:hypothetical protein
MKCVNSQPAVIFLIHNYLPSSMSKVPILLSFSILFSLHAGPSNHDTDGNADFSL